MRVRIKPVRVRIKPAGGGGAPYETGVAVYVEQEYTCVRLDKVGLRAWFENDRLEPEARGRLRKLPCNAWLGQCYICDWHGMLPASSAHDRLHRHLKEAHGA